MRFVIATSLHLKPDRCNLGGGNKKRRRVASLLLRTSLIQDHLNDLTGPISRTIPFFGTNVQNLTALTY